MISSPKSMVNYILIRHDYPMIVVRSRKKKEYLEALHRTDLTVGTAPSLGAHASKRDIQQFITYFTKLFIDEVSYDIQFLTERGANVWWFVYFTSSKTTYIDYQCVSTGCCLHVAKNKISIDNQHVTKPMQR